MQIILRLLRPYLRQCFQSVRFIKFVCFVLLTIVSIFTFNAVGTLIYGALGQSLGSTAGRYVLVMYGVMWGSTIAFALNKNKTMFLLSNMMAAAVVGFYYGGTAVQFSVTQQPWAIAGAITAGLISVGLSLRSELCVQMGLAGLRTIVIYGLAFLNGAAGFMTVSVGQWLGLILLGGSIFGLVMTGRSIGETIQYLREI